MLKDFIHLIFPETCVCCNEVLSSKRKYLCPACRQLLPVNEANEDDTFRKLAGRIKISKAVSFLKFNKSGMVQKILHELKYRNNPELGFYMGHEFQRYLLKNHIYLPQDGLIPVPLHRKRLKERGYNQAEMIAKGIAEQTGSFVLSNNLIKTIESKTQTKKSRFARLEHLSDCFTVSNSADLKGKHVGLIDDVITTGATLEACCLALEEAGIGTISIFSLASA